MPNHTKHSKKNIFRISASILLTFLLTVLFFIASTSYVVRNSLSEKTMRKIVSTFDVNSKDTTIDEWIYQYFETHYGDEYLMEFMVTEEAVAGVLDNTDFTTFVADKLIDYSQDILYDTGTGHFTSDEFMDFIEANEEAISEATGRYYFPEEFVIMREYFLTMDMFNDISAASICDSIGVPVERIRMLTSLKTFGILLSVSCLLIALLQLVNRRRIHTGIRCLGIALILNGGAYITLRVVFASLCSRVAHRIGMGASLVDSISAPVRNIIGAVGWISTALGLLFITVSIVSTIRFRKRQAQSSPVYASVSQDS